MTRAANFLRQHAVSTSELARMAVVLGCAAALLLAGQVAPYL